MLTEDFSFDTLEMTEKNSDIVVKPRLSKAAKLNYWCVEEQMIYLAYLKEHSPMINSIAYPKKHRIFSKISARIGTRTPIQVKTHHNKLKEKYKTIPRIIAFLENSLKAENQYAKQIHAHCHQSISDPVCSKDACRKMELDSFQNSFFEMDYIQNYVGLPLDCEQESLFN